VVAWRGNLWVVAHAEVFVEPALLGEGQCRQKRVLGLGLGAEDLQRAFLARGGQGDQYRAAVIRVEIAGHPAVELQSADPVGDRARGELELRHERSGAEPVIGLGAEQARQ
jgi:hypothetical protein